MSDAARELKSFYKAYIDIFNRGDPLAVNDCYAHPWNLVTQGRVVTIADKAAGLSLFSDLFGRLRGEGWAASAIDAIEAYPAGADGGLIIVDYRRVRADGSLLEAGRGCYTMERAAGSWKFAGIVESFDGRTRPS